MPEVKGQRFRPDKGIAKLEAKIDAFWFHLKNAYDIEPREYFEKRYAGKQELAMAQHYAWKREPKVADLERKLTVAREALSLAAQESRIAAVMLAQVEPSSAITIKESDRLHLASDKMRIVSDLATEALAQLDAAAGKEKS